MIRKSASIPALVVSALSLSSILTFAQEAKNDPHANCPMHMSTSKNDDESMEKRGDMGMGFSQEKTTHHFLLKADGGVIRVSANDPEDAQSREQVRMHLAHIARSFAEGNFDIPMFVHDQTPPGVPVMIAKKDRIQYRFHSVDTGDEGGAGGEVIITTSDPEALSAIHEFLRFQIQQHATGDPTTVR
jgi:hypothetical protein